MESGCVIPGSKENGLCFFFCLFKYHKVIAFIQNISTREYLAALAGKPLSAYKGYNSSKDPSTDHAFGTVTMRYGHTTVPSFMPFLDNSLKPSNFVRNLNSRMLTDATSREVLFYVMSSFSLLSGRYPTPRTPQN